MRQRGERMFSLDFQSRVPIYEQLYRSVARMASVGALEKDEALPSVRALAEELGVNPNTVQKAYAMLEHDGILYSVPGRGSFLSGDESAAARQKEIAAEKLRRAVREAAGCGMKREEILAQAVEALKEGGKTE